LRRARHQCAAFVHIFDIGGERDRAPSGALDQSNRLRQRTRQVPHVAAALAANRRIERTPRDDHRRAGGSQALGDRTADPAAAAGDERDFSGDIRRG